MERREAEDKGKTGKAEREIDLFLETLTAS